MGLIGRLRGKEFEVSLEFGGGEGEGDGEGGRTDED